MTPDEIAEMFFALPKAEQRDAVWSEVEPGAFDVIARLTGMPHRVEWGTLADIGMTGYVPR